MNADPEVNLDLLEGRAYILGRQGHIYLDSPVASKQHAELSIRDGKVYLRDLNSKNGIRVLQNGKMVRFKEGYVALTQTIVIGRRSYVIQDLLAFVSDFTATDDQTTRLEPPQWNKRNRQGRS